MCFGCSTHNAASLGLRFYYDQEHDEAVSFFSASSAHSSFPGVVHGGIISVLADEVAYWALQLQVRLIISPPPRPATTRAPRMQHTTHHTSFSHQPQAKRPALTTRLDVRYLRPARVGSTLEVRAKAKPAEAKQVLHSRGSGCCTLLLLSFL
jgi:acyl-coenzyme A thioesterase PaaI-like protein